LAGKLYSNIVSKVVYVDNIKIAEMAKLLENIYRSVNIALVNELKIFLNKINIDINKVIDAAKLNLLDFKNLDQVQGLVVIVYQSILYIYHG
jgi:UDP-N-acetyl-D-glucosamine dehydrogenase